MLDRAALESAMMEMGHSLRDAGRIIDVVFFGIETLVIGFQSQKVGHYEATVIVSDGSRALLEAANEIAQRRGWEKDWFDAARDTVGTGRSFPDESEPGLRVYRAPPGFIPELRHHMSQNYAS